MPLIHMPNPLFEAELDGAPGKLPRSLAVLVESLSLLSGLAAAPEDVILVERPVDIDQLPPALQTGRYLTLSELSGELQSMSAETRRLWRLWPWGWSASAQKLVQTLELTQAVPDLEAIRHVNTREFAAAFDVTVTEEGRLCEPRFGWLCRSESEVLAALRACEQAGEARWVIKANISHAARNRMLGAGAVLSDTQRQWLQRRLAAGACVSVEPWVERVAECGLQWFVAEESAGRQSAGRQSAGRQSAGEESAGSATAAIEFVGACSMLTDRGGEYRGSVIRRTAAAAAWWRPAEVWGRRIAEQAAACGFRGPLGIDCMLFRRRNRRELRVAHDINGRQTMGRLALSLRSRLRDSDIGVWCHPPEEPSEIHEERLRRIHDSGVTVLRTSPMHWHGQPSRLQTCLLISEDTVRLQQAVNTLSGLTSAGNGLQEVRPRDDE